ncbi:hypothetical protein HMPREF9123_1974 [Neisseria bacilliformis ATCC BAA-1200]|uniref:Uncharacterized protein n=1 Tax=Neisseria bacilliformis ATCC BAA-1200 TaxID=888742 RepID=F2BE18_9NEIS|nr:hypothetical protein HMPREF9123_1974 [Neisseria bacilliformis ATCC BAA-1200]
MLLVSESYFQTASDLKKKRFKSRLKQPVPSVMPVNRQIFSDGLHLRQGRVLPLLSDGLI